MEKRRRGKKRKRKPDYSPYHWPFKGEDQKKRNSYPGEKKKKKEKEKKKGGEGGRARNIPFAFTFPITREGREEKLGKMVVARLLEGGKKEEKKKVRSENYAHSVKPKREEKKGGGFGERVAGRLLPIRERERKKGKGERGR